MTTDPNLRVQLSKVLGHPLDASVLDRLLQLLSDWQIRNPTVAEATEQLRLDPALAELHSLISFEGATVSGGVTIGDVAGGNLVKLNFVQTDGGDFAAGNIDKRQGIFITLQRPSIPDIHTTKTLINLASDIIEHHARDLEGTLAGKLMKRSGLAEPDFYDRLHDTLKKALELLFQIHPKYELSSIEAFFHDQAVARQIGDYILNHQAIDVLQLQQALDRHLKNDATMVALIQKGYVVPQDIVPDFLSCYRRVLNLQLSVPEMGILLEVLDQNDKVQAEILASEARLRELIDSQFGTLAQIIAGASIDIREQIRDFSPYIAEKTGSFVGRDFLFQDVER